MSRNAAAVQASTDAEELSQILNDIATTSQKVVQAFMDRAQAGHRVGVDDNAHMNRLYRELHRSLMANPAAVFQAQMDFWQDYLRLLHSSTLRFWGLPSEPVIEPRQGDKRFKHEAWQSNPVFDFIKQTYLLSANYIYTLIEQAEGLDEKTARQVEFFTRQFVDALAPTNFVATNPEVLEATVKSRGRNLLRGLKNLLADVERGGGRLDIRMTDLEAFEVGRNLAVTPGKVIYQNELMQLLQYEPSTEKVHQRPLLFVPPWINKYYILDMREDNSMIRWVRDQGYTVFVISWRNPTKDLADRTFEDYMREGPLAALDAIEQATGETEINAVGYCLGGTLLATTLAYMAAKGDKRITSATFFASLIDFSEPGDLGVFIDEAQMQALEKRMAQHGYLPGYNMALTMATLRANDLVWSFYVNNYLKGEDPFPFDLLYWNQDATNMPFAMHSFYLRNMYLENKLREPGGITIEGVPIDVSKIDIPAHFISSREDHIAPWTSVFKGSTLFSGPTKFVLAGSGHIAGIINHPDANKYGYSTNNRKVADAEKWLEGAKEQKGSWWPEWERWLAHKSGPNVDARQIGAGKLKPIEDAPGSYVKEKA